MLAIDHTFCILLAYCFADTTDGRSNFKFDELQIYGRGQLAVLTDPLLPNATIYFHNMIGDRTGVIHVGSGQIMDLDRDIIDLPFSVRVYADGYLGLADATTVHGVDIYLNGTLAHVKNVTLHHDGKLSVNWKGHTAGENAGECKFDWVHVQYGGRIVMVTDPVAEPGIKFEVISLHIDGGGQLLGTHVYFHALNLTVDVGGHLSADTLGYRVIDGAAYDVDGVTLRRGFNGVINPGRGQTGAANAASGAGHGGSGGRGKGNLMMTLY